MFTVLIAEKEHIDAIQKENRLFFEPFLKNKELAFCCWNPSGQNLFDSVPELFDAVGRRKDWRVLIINHCTEESMKTRNPFDVIDYSTIVPLAEPDEYPSNSESIADWESTWKKYYESLTEQKKAIFKNALEHPLQKLSTWLCFKPEDYILENVQDKQDVNDWALEKLGSNEMKSNIKLEFLERQQYKNELRLKEEIRREFAENRYMNISYPTEIQCVSVRTTDNKFFDPDIYWNVHSENEYSAFADRNMYFDIMRFMVFDLLPKTHKNYRTDYIRFLASVLVLAENSIPSSAMQARHLYRLETDTDDTPLVTLVTSYDKKLISTSKVIDNEIEKIRSEIPDKLTDKAFESLFCTPVDVTVTLDESCDTDKAFADRDYGLFFDKPEDEFHKWNRNYDRSSKAIEHIIKQKSRSIKKSIGQMHISGEISNVDVSRLTPLQINDVREYTDTVEDEMVDSVPPDLNDISHYTKKMSEKSENVKKVIKQRMTKKTTLILATVCMALFLICFLPFLLANNGTFETVTTAVVLFGIMFVMLAAIMVVTLVVLRRHVTQAVKTYNNTVHEVIGEIQSSLKRFSKYISASCNVRRGFAVQNYASKNTDEYTMSIQIRKKHQEDIRQKRAYVAEMYGDYLGGKSFCDEDMAQPYDLDFGQKAEYEYPAPFLADDVRQIEFICSGNLITVPSSYVIRMMVKLEGIYEK